MVSVRAIYERGQLRPLEPIELAEGQEVELHILDVRGQILSALSDLLVETDIYPFEDADFDEQVVQQRLDATVQGVTLSDIIIEERQTGR